MRQAVHVVGGGTQVERGDVVVYHFFVQGVAACDEIGGRSELTLASMARRCSSGERPASAGRVAVWSGPL
ncbi:hypothetical protein [Streptomyces sp. TLI_105]|uniref:hypothetical protein n=1 Tax=Streptomyces sp. TLI_105 TaxID=1881019 RepID=UPI0011600149|nr:hypothetical protein [Streptomyces sp. TLI_105]